MNTDYPEIWLGATVVEGAKASPYKVFPYVAVCHPPLTEEDDEIIFTIKACDVEIESITDEQLFEFYSPFKAYAEREGYRFRFDDDVAYEEVDGKIVVGDSYRNGA